MSKINYKTRIQIQTAEFEVGDIPTVSLDFRNFFYRRLRRAGNFVIGFGSSIGFGVSATIIDFNLNGGSTSRANLWKK